MTCRPLALAALMTLAGCGGPADPHLETVRAYLKENLDDPDFTEVRWWGAKPIDAYNRSLALDEKATQFLLKDQPGRESEVEASRRRQQKVESAPPAVFGRLKYRTANRAGASELRDELFRFDADGKVVSRITASAEGFDGAFHKRRAEFFPE